MEPDAVYLLKMHETAIKANNIDYMNDMEQFVKRSKTKKHKNLMKKGRQEFHKK
jgi:hypothetical protein